MKNQSYALAIYQEIGDNDGLANSYGNIGVIYGKQGNLVEAKKSFISTLKIKEKINDKSGIAKCQLNIGSLCQMQGNYAEAMNYFLSSLNLSLELKDNATIARNYMNIGVLYHNQGNYAEALKTYLNGLDVLTELGEKNGIAQFYDNIGIIYYNRGNYPDALKYFISSIKIRQEIGDKSGIANSYNGIGSIYLEQGNYSEALDNFKASLKIKEEIGDKNGIEEAYNNIGLIYLKQNNYPEALINFSACLNMAKEIGNKKEVAGSYLNIGNINYLQKKYADALNNFFSALKISQELNDKDRIGKCLINIGSSYVREKKHADALQYLNDGVAISKDILSKDNIKNGYLGYADAYAGMGRYDSAYEYYQLYSMMSDSLINENSTAQINEMKTKYETEMKEQQINLLQKDSALVQIKLNQKLDESRQRLNQIIILNQGKLIDSLDIKQKKDQLFAQELKSKDDLSKIDLLNKDKKLEEQRARFAEEEIQKQKLQRNFIASGAGIIVLSSLISFFFYKRKRDAEQRQKETSLNLQVSETEMKALRSQMNPHFIFNALQSIQTFLMSHKPDDANIYLLKFSKLMRAVLENSQHREISLKKDMQALELYMQLESIRLPHPFTYQFHIDENVDAEETTIPPLILQPFVENAIWHGLQYKPGPGHINIYISKKENALYATVEDNGVGRDLSKKAAQPMLLKKESLGMKLTEERLKILNELKKIKAQFKITDLFTTDHQPAGTKVELSLPLVA